MSEWDVEDLEDKGNVSVSVSEPSLKSVESGPHGQRWNSVTGCTVPVKLLLVRLSGVSLSRSRLWVRGMVCVCRTWSKTKHSNTKTVR